MIVRIVQMTFREDRIKTFTDLFGERRHTIRNFKGCMHLELWQDSKNPAIFFTYSHWESETDLDHYRFSEFFKDTWSKTKALFAEKPQAWSVVVKAEI
ncbi:MAG: antibiotic biosynthesis monooxygenase [Flavipsychrobacter sp.]|jgi:quinol monooxygenase YgiN|nr:antibiotic biosynthesis monooxygenase [Flavipsychrobacter sp.]